LAVIFGLLSIAQRTFNVDLHDYERLMSNRCITFIH